MGFFRLSPFKRSVRSALAVAFLGSLIISTFAPQYHVLASPALTVLPLTWNVTGLDSNNVSVGPDNFPVGARVCNTADATSTLTATFVWDDGQPVDTFINLRAGSQSTLSISSLGAGTVGSPTCHDFYFEV